MRAQKNAQPFTEAGVVLDVIIQNYILLYAALRFQFCYYKFGYTSLVITSSVPFFKNLYLLDTWGRKEHPLE